MAREFKDRIKMGNVYVVDNMRRVDIVYTKQGKKITVEECFSVWGGKTAGYGLGMPSYVSRSELDLFRLALDEAERIVRAWAAERDDGSEEQS